MTGGSVRLIFGWETFTSMTSSWLGDATRFRGLHDRSRGASGLDRSSGVSSVLLTAGEKMIHYNHHIFDFITN